MVRSYISHGGVIFWNFLQATWLTCSSEEELPLDFFLPDEDLLLPGEDLLLVEEDLLLPEELLLEGLTSGSLTHVDSAKIMK